MDARSETTRRLWLETLDRYRGSLEHPDSPDCWSRTYDLASRDELTTIQNAKLKVLTPFLYENSGFYRRRFDRLGAIPSDIQSLEDLVRWPVVTKEEMSQDALEHPPMGTYLTIGDAQWRDRGWMQFSTSGSTGQPRAFRYTQIDRLQWAWANTRALYAMGIRRGETILPIGGFGPHVWLWGVMEALKYLNVGVIPGGGLDGPARARLVHRFRPTIVACTVSYALYLGRVMQDLGLDPASSSVHTLFIGGEPGVSVPATRQRLQKLWGARTVEFYGCTEASPHAGGFSCGESDKAEEPFTHLLEDVQIWETVDAEQRLPTAPGERGLTVCTSLNSESSPQLRFLVGDYTTYNRATCACGRSHVRAMGSFCGRADDVINLRGIKFFPSQIEEVIRTQADIGDEYEILLSTAADGLDVMTLRVEHPSHEIPTALADKLARDVRTRCEVRASVEVLRPGTLPKTESKAKRVRDLREKESK